MTLVDLIPTYGECCKQTHYKFLHFVKTTAEYTTVYEYTAEEALLVWD